MLRPLFAPLGLLAATQLQLRGYAMARKLGRQRLTRPERRERRRDWQVARMQAKLGYQVHRGAVCLFLNSALRAYAHWACDTRKVGPGKCTSAINVHVT